MIQVNRFARITTMIPMGGLATFGERAAGDVRLERRHSSSYRLVIYLLVEKFLSCNRDFY